MAFLRRLLVPVRQTLASSRPSSPARDALLEDCEEKDWHIGADLRGEQTNTFIPARGRAIHKLLFLFRFCIIYILAPLVTGVVLLILFVFIFTSPLEPVTSIYEPGAIGFKSQYPGSLAAPLADESNVATSPRKAIVFASFVEQDTSWYPEIPKGYVLDDPDPVDGLSVPRDQGREAMAYLTYIIDHYDDLADYIVFHHGHRRAWHQPEPTPDKLRALNLTALTHDRYINFRCARNPGCTADTVIDVAKSGEDEWRIHAVMLPKFWNTMFGEQSPWSLGEPPDVLSVPCCAQFAVTRENILSKPREFWQYYRSPLERDLDDFAEIWGEAANSYYVGICYEKLWHMLFGQPATHCPSEEYCRGVQFSDALICNKYTGPYEKSFGWEAIECVQKYQDSW